MGAQVQFIDAQLSLIHIPLHLYPHFVQPILQLLFFPENETHASGERQREPWASWHRFLNVSVTPIECSIVCSTKHAQELFGPLIDALGDVRDQVSVTPDDYLVIQVDGEGLDAGRRVVELTSPLALAGISIFFITTYFADYILVPTKSRGLVIEALQDRGFVFERHTDTFVSHSHHHHHHASHASSSSVEGSTSNPALNNLNDLQARTFTLLSHQNVSPAVDPQIRLVQCAARKDTYPDGRSIHADQLHLGLMRSFVSRPRFLSITLTDTEPASILLEKRLLRFFGSAEVLLGSSREDVLIPIMLDLRELPLESTGIVCGVAGRLVGATARDAAAAAGAHHGLPSPAVDMSYLSTARAGTVMVGEHELERAIEALRPE